MPLWSIIALVFIIYIRSLKYNYVMDDCVKRDGYLKEHPTDTTPVEVCSKRPSIAYRLFMIGMHCVNVSIIYLLWGWAPALLFAVHPIGVWGAVWVTGNYYATTAYFVLISYYLIVKFNLIGTLFAVPIFTAALNSTLTGLVFPFFLIGSGKILAGIIMLVPMYMFLTGRRFRGGIKVRRRVMIEIPEECKEKIFGIQFDPRRLALMVKVVARYIHKALYPRRLNMFHPFGKGLNDKGQYKEYHSLNLEFYISLILCLVVIYAGMISSPVATAWFFIFILLWSRWNLYGQFFAERYLYLPLVGICVIAGTMLTSQIIILTIITTALVVRTVTYIPTFRNVESMLKNDADMYPNYAMVLNNYAGWLFKYNHTHPSEYMLIHSYLLRAEALEPGCWEVQVNLALFYNNYGDIERCLLHTNKAIEILQHLKYSDYFDEELKIMYNQRKSVEEEIAKRKAELNNATA